MSKFNLRDKIESWDTKEMVRFSLYCCNKVKHMMGDKSLKAVELVEKWLEDKTSVSDEELRTSINDTYCTNRNVTLDIDISDHFVNNASYYAVSSTYISTDIPTNRHSIAYYVANAVYNAAHALDSSMETLYLEYIRSRLSDIMEG